MTTIEEVCRRNLEIAIEAYMNRVTFEYDPSNPECDEESVYAFDLPNKSCPNNWHTFKGCHCPNFGIDYDLRSEYAFDTTANGEVESVYAFDYEEDGSDEDESIEAKDNKKYISLAQKAAMLKRIEKQKENRKIEGGKKVVAILATGCVPLILAFVLPFLFGLMSFLVSSAVFVWALAEVEYERSIRQDYEKTVQRINSFTVLTDEVDDSEAHESEDDIDPDNDYDGQSSVDDDGDTDEVVSVYAFDAIDHDVTHEADEAVCFESDPIEATPPKVTSSFGIRVPNLGEGLEYCHHADSEDGHFEFSDSVTFFKTNTDKHVYLMFEGQDLKAVVNRGNAYTSFGEMPSEVADIFVIAHVGIIHMQ